MFSFIKFVQELIAKLKKNKGLWFTTISAISIIGIVVTMYVLMSMTSNVSKKVYQSMSEGYQLKLESILDTRKMEYKKIFVTLSNDKNLITLIEKNNQKELQDLQNDINEGLDKSGYKDSFISFYPNDVKLVHKNTVNTVITTRQELYGIDVMTDGVFITLTEPIIKNDKVLGVIEIKESINSLKNNFKVTNQKFLFVLDQKMFAKLSLKAKSGRYKDVMGDYKVEQSEYDSKFYSKITELGEDSFKDFMKNGYFVDDVYYKAYKKVTDINGADIGLFVVGEMTEGSDGFVNIADNMTKTVTTVALGLVISILLFMF